MRFSFKKALASVLSFALILTAFTGVLTTNAAEPVNKGTLTLSDVSVDANAGSFDVVADIVLTEASAFATAAFQLGDLPEGVVLDSASVDSAVGTVTVDAAKNLVVFEGEQNAVANISITLGFTMTGVDSSFAISVVKVEYADATEGDYVLDYTDTAVITVNQIHGPAAEWSYDDTNHYHACTAEGCDEQFDVATHELTVQETPSDCDTAGSRVYTCSVCGYSRTEVIDPTGHTPVVDPAVAATCASTGLTEGSHCSVCGAIIVAQEVVPMLPHTEGTPVDNGDGTHTVSCTVCGEPIRTEAHNYVDGECACGAVEAPAGPILDESLASALTSTKISISNKFGFYFSLYLGNIPYDDFEFVVSKPEIGSDYNYTGETLSKTYTKDTCDSNSMPQVHGYFITYSDVALYEMSVPVTFTLYVTKDGATKYYTFDAMSLADLANDKYLTDGDVKVKSLMVDMLNLGTEAQVYFGKSGAPGNPLTTFALPNADVNQDYATKYGKLTDIGGRRDPQFTSLQLQLLSAPSLYYSFRETNYKTPADLTFTASYYSKALGQEVTTTINGADLSEDELKYSQLGGYFFSYDNVALYDTDKKITLTISATDGSSWVYESSVESLLAGMVDVEGDAQALYRATAAFGASTHNYWPDY